MLSVVVGNEVPGQTRGWHSLSSWQFDSKLLTRVDVDLHVYLRDLIVNFLLFEVRAVI